MMRDHATPPPRPRVAIRFAVLIGLALVACLIECKFVLAIQTRIRPEYPSFPAPTISLANADLGNAFVFHAALNGNVISDTQDSQLILGIDSTLLDKRFVSVSPWLSLELELTDPAGAKIEWPVLEGTSAPKPEAGGTKIPEMMDDLDVAAKHADFTSLQWPHHAGMYGIYFLKHTPTWTTFRERPNYFHVLSRPGKYRLRIIYQAPEGPRVLGDYDDLWVQ